MTRACVALVLVLAHVLTTPGVAQAGEEEPASFAVMILPGEIPSARFAEGVPNLGFNSDWEWQALVCGRKCTLEPVKLLMTPVQVMPHDGDPLPGHRYAVDGDTESQPLVLLHGLPSGFRTRPDTYLHANMGTYASSTPGTMEIDIPSPGELSRIVPRYAGLIDGTTSLRIYLETKTRRQLLGTMSVDAIAGPSALARREQMLRWAGDLDGDGKLDLIMNFSSRYGEDASATLFLSSSAKPDEIVGAAGAFSYWPVGNPGC
jgi:hypothetical protein